MHSQPSVEPIEFSGGAGARLAGTLYRPSSDTEVVGAALLAHCFTCSKDLFTTTRIAKGLAGGGYQTLAFDLTGLGESGGRLADTTVATNVSDLTQAAVALIRLGVGPCVLVGHSLGGAAAILAASRLHTVTAVVAVASPASATHVEHLFDAESRRRIRERGSGEVVIGSRPVLIGRDFLDDLRRHDVAAAAAGLGRPLLVVQAGADDVVGREQTEALGVAGSATRRTVAGADHLFSDRRHSDELVGVILEWLAEQRTGR
ncbi:MAG: alpha/beta hydrolase [bacterium]|nr:alpha/beta hydrolase [bacterium]